jgi:hypothetical protein
VDVDILVNREDLGRADAALSMAGFEALEVHIPPSEDDNEFWITSSPFHAEAEFISPPSFTDSQRPKS